jgi:hypothetical protein
VWSYTSSPPACYHGLGRNSSDRDSDNTLGYLLLLLLKKEKKKKKKKKMMMMMMIQVVITTRTGSCKAEV